MAGEWHHQFVALVTLCPKLQTNWSVLQCGQVSRSAALAKSCSVLVAESRCMLGKQASHSTLVLWVLSPVWYSWWLCWPAAAACARRAVLLLSLGVHIPAGVDAATVRAIAADLAGVVDAARQASWCAVQLEEVPSTTCPCCFTAADLSPSYAILSAASGTATGSTCCTSCPRLFYLRPSLGAP